MRRVLAQPRRTAFPLGAALFALAVCLLASPAARGVTVDFYTSLGPNGSATGLNLAHALIADGADGDRNGINDKLSASGIYVGDGIPDGLQVSVLEYAYATASAPYHALAASAFDQNLAGLIGWNDGICLYPNGDGPGSTEETPVYGGLFAYAENTYCDLYDGYQTPLCFPGCTPQHAILRELAAYLAVSVYATHADSKWKILNYGETVQFDLDPRFDRSAASVFGFSGDLDGDGFTNLEEFQSVDRATRLETPSLQVPGVPIWDLLKRAQKDAFIGRYLDVAMFTPGVDPNDPTPPLLSIVAQSQSRWLEESTTGNALLYVTVHHALPPVTYQWLKDGIPLVDGAAVSGSSSPNLTLGPPLATGATGTYVCLVTDQGAGKTQVASSPISLTVYPSESLPATSPTGVGIFLLTSILGFTARIWRSTKAR